MLFVRDVDKLKQFYTRFFKLDIIEETPAMWLVLSGGGCELALHKIPDEYMPANATVNADESNTKIVFETTDHLHELHASLLAEQIGVGQIKTFENYPYWICDGQDPEGNVFQLRQRKQ